MSNNSARVFAKQLKDFATLCQTREKRLFARVVRHVQTSITVGSPITGAPGQPVKTGKLLRSYKRIGTLADEEVTIASYVPYAGIIEDNVRGATLRSKVGGFHSIKLTVASFDAIVAYELSIVKGGVQL